MKRDMELIRLLLLKLEETESFAIISSSFIEGYDDSTVLYHFDLLIDGGYAIGEVQNDNTGGFAQFEKLTWKGHEFLDAAREPTRWGQAMSIAKTAGGMTLPVLQNLLGQLLSRSVGLS